MMMVCKLLLDVLCFGQFMFMYAVIIISFPHVITYVIERPMEFSYFGCMDNIVQNIYFVT